MNRKTKATIILLLLTCSVLTPTVASVQARLLDGIRPNPNYPPENWIMRFLITLWEMLTRIFTRAIIIGV